MTPIIVMPGLDPGIHPSQDMDGRHGLPGQARQWRLTAVAHRV